MPYITYEVTCPVCHQTVIKKRSAAHPEPVYCGTICASRGRSGANHPTRKHHFTEAMNTAIIQACRSGKGALKVLWQQDPYFHAMPYPSLRRQAWVLGCIRTGPAAHWADDERAYATEAYLQGRSLDSIAQSLRRRGWYRSPAAVMARMRDDGVHRWQGDSLSCAQVAATFGVDHKVVGRWITRGWLKVHHYSDGFGETRYIHLRELRRFLVKYPSVVAQGKPDIVWLIGMLTMPGAGHNDEVLDDDDEGRWMNNTPVDIGEEAS